MNYSNMNIGVLELEVSNMNIGVTQVNIGETHKNLCFVHLIITYRLKRLLKEIFHTLNHFGNWY